MKECIHHRQDKKGSPHYCVQDGVRYEYRCHGGHKECNHYESKKEDKMELKEYLEKIKKAQEKGQWKTGMTTEQETGHDTSGT